MNEQRDILDAAKEMPSSLNDACRTIEAMADEIGGLRAQVEMDTQRFKEMEEHGLRLEAQLASARKALEEIIDAEKEFREQMGADWEGDPVSDACDRAKLLLTDEEGNL